jgi:hypothetical protein
MYEKSVILRATAGSGVCFECFVCFVVGYIRRLEAGKFWLGRTEALTLDDAQRQAGRLRTTKTGGSAALMVTA